MSGFLIDYLKSLLTQRTPSPASHKRRNPNTCEKNAEVLQVSGPVGGLGDEEKGATREVKEQNSEEKGCTRSPDVPLIDPTTPAEGTRRGWASSVLPSLTVFPALPSILLTTLFSILLSVCLLFKGLLIVSYVCTLLLKSFIFSTANSYLFLAFPMQHFGMLAGTSILHSSTFPHAH